MLQLEAILKDKGQLSDGTRKAELLFQECPPDQLYEILKNSGKMGWFIFDTSRVKEEVVASLPEIKPEFKNQKSPSERLRNVLYIDWQKNTDQTKPFEEWRVRKMEEIIDWVKQRL